MANESLIRYPKIRKADSLDDQLTASDIELIPSSAVTQQDVQEGILSQIKRIIWGDSAGNWGDDFIAGGFSSLSGTDQRHEALRQLIHFLDEGPAQGFVSGSHKQVIGSPFPTSIIWWESAAMLKKIVEKEITRTGGPATVVTPTPITWRIYDTDGTTVLASVQDDVTYNGVFETSRTRTIS